MRITAGVTHCGQDAVRAQQPRKVDRAGTFGREGHLGQRSGCAGRRGCLGEGLHQTHVNVAQG